MKDYDPPLIIINQAAANARRAWPTVREKLQQQKIAFETYETTQPGDATIATRAALERGSRTIAVVGGDGTLSEAAEGFFLIDERQTEPLPDRVCSDAALAILPAGTGDDFARGLLGGRANLERWIGIFVAYVQRGSAEGTRSVDVLYGNCDNLKRPFICLNASTMGLGGETAARVAAQGSLLRSLSGETRFIAAAVGALFAWREKRVRVAVGESTVIDGYMNLVAVANNRYAGGGMMLSPQAQIDDGQLDVVTATGLSRTDIIRELPRIHTGGHVANPKVRIMQSTRVKVETLAQADALLIEADGNVRGRTPVEFRVLPRALRFVVG
jgi:diacylglycerol kinase (ATP)